MSAHGINSMFWNTTQDNTRRQIDIVALGIVTASILLFVAVGSAIGPSVVRSLSGGGPGPNAFLLNAFLLNIAIIIFGWSRYRELCAEIAARRQAEREALRMASTDAMTGFLNRRSFDAGVAALLAQTAAGNRSLALVMIDLDNFKQVNDYNGHAVGDLLLRECARRMTAVFPANALIGRIGGDEFAAALLFDPRRPGTMERTATALVTAIAQPLQVGDVFIDTTASVGLARSDQLEADHRDAAALLDMADVAMYHAKRQGRNAYAWFEPHMADEMRFRSELEQGIREGIGRGEFVPFYEQQIDLMTGELTGFEMLARWDSPQFGLIAPDIFIPVAEEIGAIGDLSQSVIAQALEDARTWDSKLTLAVNISPVQLRDPWFAQKLLHLLVDANFPPQRLEIEITESCLHDNLAQVSAIVTSLKNQGVCVSLDDFGTGYSSIGQLRHIPFDRIKIDRSFVSRLIEDKDSAAIVRAIAVLGEGLDMPVTAEGIETQDVLEHLRQFAGITGQGYLYGRPRRAHELSDWLESGKPDADEDPLARRA
ncbi:putative bifunctional diguanylate cyclase/phosphodiesterase [Novosphingobium sp. Leaf2]|uniref:putative bifunctional diguanylate cyclase/phosphodiesterase n=1 Tax=Novosphingobium sp. Leaf2 TaxID=1735670 RepID=UPI001F2E1F45|nr:EAL domain-containing protein [Novosphingobium sp. Leaf2]